MLLHNFFGSTETWPLFIPEFSRHYQLIVLDMRGHGRSTNPTGEFTHRLYSHDVFELLNQLGVNTFKAVGHSSGAMTLLHMGTQQADRVEAMVLSGGTPYYSDEHRAIARTLDIEGSDDPEVRQRSKIFRDFKDSYDDMNFTPPLLSTITAKTLIVHGDWDEQ